MKQLLRVKQKAALMHTLHKQTVHTHTQGFYGTEIDKEREKEAESAASARAGLESKAMSTVWYQNKKMRISFQLLFL